MRTNFHMEEKYIRMVKGDTLSFGVKILDEEGNAFDQDLDTAVFSCKSNRTDDQYVFQKLLSDGISKTGAGEYVVRVPPEDTADAQAGKYFYDFEIGVNGDKFTILHGVLELEQDITV